MEEEREKEKKENSTELQKPNVEAEVLNLKFLNACICQIFPEL